MLKEFREFAMRGNVLDMAIGVIIGGAFGKIVSSLVSDVLMPPLGLLMGKVDFSSLFINLSDTSHPSLVAAKAAELRLSIMESFCRVCSTSSLLRLSSLSWSSR